MKKDYLAEGSMADTADLVVLGGYYGSGNKGEEPRCADIKCQQVLNRVD